MIDRRYRDAIAPDGKVMHARVTAHNRIRAMRTRDHGGTSHPSPRSRGSLRYDEEQRYR